MYLKMRSTHLFISYKQYNIYCRLLQYDIASKGILLNIFYTHNVQL